LRTKRDGLGLDTRQEQGHPQQGRRDAQPAPTPRIPQGTPHWGYDRVAGAKKPGRTWAPLRP
jgi:hypothetical protein